MAETGIAPQGSDSGLSWAFESVNQIPGTFENAVAFSSLTGLRPKPTLVPTTNMARHGQALQGQYTKMDYDLGLAFQPDVDTEQRLIAAHCGKYAFTNLDSGVERVEISPWEYGDADPATRVASIALLADPADDRPVLITGARIGSMSWQIANGALTMLTTGLKACHRTYMGDPVETAVDAAYTGKLYVRGMRSDPESAVPLVVAVTTGGGSGAAVINVKRGVMAISNSHTITFDSWQRVKYADNTAIGPHRWNTVWLYFSSGGVLTAGDTFTIPVARTMPALTYSARGILQAAGVELSINGNAPVLIRNATFTQTLSLVPKMGAGSIYPEFQQRSGDWTAMLSFERDYDNKDLINALERSESITNIVLDSYGLPLDDAYDERHKIEMATAQYEGVTIDINSKGAQSESVSVRAGRTGSDPLFKHTIVGSKAGITG